MSAARVPPRNEMKVSRFRRTAFDRQKDREWKDWSLTAVCSNGTTSKPSVDTRDGKWQFLFSTRFRLATIDSRKSLFLPPSCQASQNEIYRPPRLSLRLSRESRKKVTAEDEDWNIVSPSSIISLLLPRSCHYHPLLRFLLFLSPNSCPPLLCPFYSFL